MTQPILPRVYDGLCQWCDHLDGDRCTRCDQCASHARWAVAMPEGDGDDFTTRAFACSRHLAAVLTRYDWPLDVAQLYDLGQLP